MKQNHFTFTSLKERRCRTTFTFNIKMRVLFVLICCCMALPVVSQQRRATTPQQRRITVSQPQKTSFEFYVYENATFKKAGDTDYYVVNMGKKSAHQLYMDILSHISSIYRNPERVISKVEDRSIVINGYANEVSYFKDRQGYSTSVSFKYRIELQFKDGKIRVNAPDLLDIYTSNALGDNKLSDYSLKYIVYLFDGETAAMKKEIDKYINMLITTIVYGSKDDDW